MLLANVLSLFFGIIIGCVYLLTYQKSFNKKFSSNIIANSNQNHFAQYLIFSLFRVFILIPLFFISAVLLNLNLLMVMIGSIISTIALISKKGSLI